MRSAWASTPVGSRLSPLDQRPPPGLAGASTRSQELDGVFDLHRLDLHHGGPGQERARRPDRELVLGPATGHHQRPASADGLVEGVDRGSLQAGRRLVQPVQDGYDPAIEHQAQRGVRAVGVERVNCRGSASAYFNVLFHASE